MVNNTTTMSIYPQSLSLSLFIIISKKSKSLTIYHQRVMDALCVCKNSVTPLPHPLLSPLFPLYFGGIYILWQQTKWFFLFFYDHITVHYYCTNYYNELTTMLTYWHEPETVLMWSLMWTVIGALQTSKAYLYFSVWQTVGWQLTTHDPTP